MHVQSDDAWVKLNAGQYGFYRGQYPQLLWTRLAAASNSTASPITSSDLAGLMDDSYALALLGNSPITNFLTLSRYPRETSLHCCSCGTAALLSGCQR